MEKVEIYKKEREKSRQLHIKAKELNDLEAAKEHSLDMFLFSKMIEIEESKHSFYIYLFFLILSLLAFFGMFFV